MKLFFRKGLDIHEDYEINYAKGRLTIKDFVPLCFSCHMFIHDGYLKILLNNGKVSYEVYKEVLDRGNKILEKHDLKKPDYPYLSAPWEDWRMVVMGVELEPKFKSFEDWKAHFQNKKPSIKINSIG